MAEEKIDFVLDQFDSNITMAVATIPMGEEPPVITADATAVYYVSVDSMKNAFYFRSDSRDLSNNDASDIKYYVKWPSNYILNPSHAFVTPNSEGTPDNRIATTDADGTIPNDRLLVKHDFIRHIAKDLFNTHLAVDLFENETEITEDLAVKGHDDAWTAIKTSILAVSDGGSQAPDGYTTNAIDGSANLCRVLMRQILEANPARFYDFTTLKMEENPDDDKFFIPFINGDSISFKVIYKAAPLQHEILASRKIAGTPVADRSYRIKIEIVTAVGGQNIAVTDSVLHPTSVVANAEPSEALTTAV